MEIEKEKVVGINNTPPRRKSSIMVRDLDEETMLYDPDTKQIHVLNNTALRVWQLCDGRHSIKDIAAAVTKILPSGGRIDKNRIGQDVRSIIDDFAAQSMVE